MDLQKWLKNNIELIEKQCKSQYFYGKEKLIADCIRSISNYICITWSEGGKKLYEDKEISVIVLELLQKYLRESKTPL